MERIKIYVNHQTNKGRKRFKTPNGYEADHIIPYCISLDDSKKNIQFLKKLDHRKKTIIDKKIIKKFRKKGWIEKITHYSHDLKRPISFLTKEYIKEFHAFQGFHSNLRLNSIYNIIPPNHENLTNPASNLHRPQEKVSRKIISNTLLSYLVATHSQQVSRCSNALQGNLFLILNWLVTHDTPLFNKSYLTPADTIKS